MAMEALGTDRASWSMATSRPRRRGAHPTRTRVTSRLFETGSASRRSCQPMNSSPGRAVPGGELIGAAAMIGYRTKTWSRRARQQAQGRGEHRSRSQPLRTPTGSRRRPSPAGRRGATAGCVTCSGSSEGSAVRHDVDDRGLRGHSAARRCLTAQGLPPGRAREICGYSGESDGRGLGICSRTASGGLGELTESRFALRRRVATGACRSLAPWARSRPRGEAGSPPRLASPWEFRTSPARTGWWTVRVAGVGRLATADDGGSAAEIPTTTSPPERSRPALSSSPHLA